MSTMHVRRLMMEECIARALAAERSCLSSPGPSADLRILKSERVTLVWAAPWEDGEGPAVFKLYRHMGLLKPLRSRISFGRRAEREFTALTRLYGAGVPCPKPITWSCGHSRDAGFYQLLVTREIPKAVSLETMGTGGAGFGDLDAEPLFKVLRAAHAWGVYHGALAPRNILVTRRADGAPEFHLIDMARSFLFPCDIAGTSMGRRDLLSLSMYVVRRGGVASLPSLVSAYGLPEHQRERFMADLRRMKSSSFGRDRAAVVFGARSVIAARRGLRSPEWMRAAVRDRRGHWVDVHYRCDKPQWREVAERYWNGELPDLRVVKRHDWGGVTHVGEVPGLGVCYFKRFSIRSVKYLHKPARARHTVDHQAHVAGIGFQGPEALCLIERRRAGVLVESAVLLAALTDWISLHLVVNAGQGDVARCHDEKRRLLRAFGREVGRRHRRGVFHGDLHLGNVYCRRSGEEFSFAWIDNEEGSVWRRLPMRLRIHDLDHINRFRHKLSLTDRMVMWRAYADEAGLPPSLQRKICRRLIASGQRFWRKKGWMA